MSLSKYKTKRSFKTTPEPQGGKARSSPLHFVVQKHQASHLHYDFRLEMDDVLKSWAVPKGPSMDSKVKRLAMMVEDHPLDYSNFEGIIPKGNYGAGTVMVWDKGEYEVETEANSKLSKKEQNLALTKELKAGKLKFVLHGKKLKGLFALVKAQNRGDSSWLLMKLKDKYEDSKDIALQDRSVLSKRTMDGISKITQGLKKKSTIKDKTVVKNKSTLSVKKSKPDPILNELIKDLPDTKFPSFISPMLATLVDKPFDHEGWDYELKWDGYRTLAFMNNDQVDLKSRNDKSFNEKFYPIRKLLSEMNIKGVVDGEIVVLNNEGVPDFGKLQNWKSEADGKLAYYIFDVLWFEGKDVTRLPFVNRRKILESIPMRDEIKISESFQTKGTEFYSTAKSLGMEGVIAKKSDSLYYAGERSSEWLKIKINKRQEVVIGGYTQNEGTSKLFSALLVGVYRNEELHYIGKIGTGFTDKMQKEMLVQLKKKASKTNPFANNPDVNKPSRFKTFNAKASVTWLKPDLVCEVSFTEITSDGVMRHPSFEGMRIDKDASSVVQEKEVKTKDVIKNTKTRKVNGSSDELLNPTEQTQARDVKGHTIKFTNLDKIYWPELNISKRDMINYYYQAAPYILPYLKDRPQSLNRFPDGIHGKHFYQKDVTDKVPDWTKKYLYHSSDDATDKHFMVVTDEADILLMASMGCIELHPWSSRTSSPDNPDWCLIDLDPDKNSFDQVIEAAQVTKKILDAMKVPSFCKTSGSTGLHIYIPLGAKYSYEQSKEFARVIVTLVQKELPKYTTLERTKSNRHGKMYLDFLQNRPQATLAAPYSLRPTEKATVSMPLQWNEVKKGMRPEHFTITNALERIKKEGDSFKPVLGKGINIEKIIDELQSVL